MSEIHGLYFIFCFSRGPYLFPSYLKFDTLINFFTLYCATNLLENIYRLILELELAILFGLLAFGHPLNSVLYC